MNLHEKREKLLLVLNERDMRIQRLQAELADLLQQQQQLVGAVRFCDELMAESTPRPAATE